MFLGVVLSAPIIGYEVYNFVNPGLYPHERRAVYPFIIAFTMLFSIGALFGLLILAPFVVWTLILFSEFVASQPVLSVLDFYSTIFTTVVLSGFSFTLPAIFVLLVKLGILKTLIITENRAYFYGALYIITAVITPDGGPLADLALFIPVVLMIEASVYIAKRYEKQREVTSIGDKTESNGANRCKFCGHKLRRWEIFCSNCDRSQI